MKKPMYASTFIVRKVTTDRAVSSLSKNNIEVNAKEAETILNLLYHVANVYNKQEIKRK